MTRPLTKSILAVATLILLAVIRIFAAEDSFLNLAERPPMGWNSWDCFGCTVTESLTKTNTDYMAARLARYGWQYIVVDIQWYEPQSTGWNYAREPKPALDDFGRLLPVPAKFPSSTNGNDFKPLADYVHAKGLKFGLHLMRGIPREAVKRNTPILGSTNHAADIANTNSTCKWNPDMFGVDMAKPGAQEYYNSVFKLLASWNLDFVKVDDLARPYHAEEIEGIRKAIDQCGRKMVLSISPGATPLAQATHVMTNANLWRLTDDFWDDWKLLKHAFDTCNNWTPYRDAGHWPDPDMLPLGAIRVGPKMEHHSTKFTPDEQRTLMTLWCISRAPLMFGGHLPWTDPSTFSLIANDEVLTVDQASANNRQLFRTNDLIAWAAEIPDSPDRYIALFNTQDMSNIVSVDLSALGFQSAARARDLWSHEDLGNVVDYFAQTLPPHGAGLFRISPNAARASTNAAASLQAKPFPLSRVRLLDGPFKQRQDVDAQYLRSVAPDRLLAGFREQAGMPAKAQRYGGWEARGINGHSLGHYLSALSLLYASTGEAWIRERIDYMVDELAACQQANGDGYVLPVPKKVYEDIQAGKINASGFSLNDWWVPNYTLHKVMAGLRDAYRLGGNKRALEVERSLANWLNTILSGLTDTQIQQMLKAEHGGMIEVLTDLYEDTGEPRYLEMARRDFTHNAVLTPLMHGEDRLNGLHGNTQIPKLIGLAREYELTSDATFRTAAETFWNSVVNRRSYAIGGHGENEHFFPPEQFPNKLTPHTCETCNTYNMLKLTGHLFSWEPRADEMDFVERALINHLLANIGQQPGEFGYFLGLSSVGKKVFSTESDSWWCCVGTGMENPARYGEQVYFHDDNTLWVNLYMASVLSWEEKGVTLQQQTRFPEEDTVRFTFTSQKPTSFSLKLRHPYWCKQPAVKINGKTFNPKSSPSSYLAIDRIWKTGDVIELRLPMSLHLEPLPHSDGKTLATMYGPMVLAGIVPPEAGSSNSPPQRFADHLKAKGKTGGTGFCRRQPGRSHCAPAAEAKCFW